MWLVLKDSGGCESDEEEDNLHNLIIGDSIVQGIDEQLFHKGKNNKVASLRGKGIEQVRKLFEEFHGKDPLTIVIHVGSNDLTKDSPEAVNRAFESLVEYVKHKFINSQILISFPLEGVDNFRVSQNLDRFTRLLKNVCNKNIVSYTANNKLSNECFRKDGVHLNRKGTSFLVGNVKNQLMGFKPREQRDSSKRFKRDLHGFSRNDDSANTLLKQLLEGLVKMLPS